MSSGRVITKPLIHEQWKLNFRHPFRFCSILLLAWYTSSMHSKHLSVWFFYSSAAWCSSVLTGRELLFLVAAPVLQPWGVNLWLFHVSVKIAPVNRQTAPLRLNLLRRYCLYVLQRISGTLFYLSCLQKIRYCSITFRKKRLQTARLRSRVQKTATNPKELTFMNKMIEFWGHKLRGLHSVIMMTVNLVLIGSNKTQNLFSGKK